MEEKERPAEEEEEQEEQEREVTHDVTINGAHVVVKLKYGATLEDLIEELIRLGLIDGVRGFTVMLDGHIIQYDPETGKLSENPILARDSTLSLLKKVRGGS